MKFLHTADLHLGRIFYEYPILDDQQYMLDQLMEILTGGSYNALVISGDVYDRSIPSPEALSMFSAFLGKLRRQCPETEVLIIPGNHDSAARLGFARELLGELGVRIVIDPEEAFEPVIISGGSGDCAFFLLPFLSPG
ncbi:exonuclease subunit SbcD, partial [Treponema sp. OttesenSCG-928-L16]|nr:exonuclease subunit SbcD [Treponema sp. OttesenSCG-928-L16]